MRLPPDPICCSPDQELCECTIDVVLVCMERPEKTENSHLPEKVLDFINLNPPFCEGVA